MSSLVTKIQKTKKPDELLKLLTALNEQECQRYRTVHNEWEKNVLFWMGKQWLTEKSGTDGFTILEEDDDHYRPVTNYIARACDLKRSQIVGKVIRPSVKPNSYDKQDIDAAQLGHLVLKALEEIDCEGELDSLAVLHAELFGIAWRSDTKECSKDDKIERERTQEIRTPMFKCLECQGISEEPTKECPMCGGEVEFTEDVSEELVIDPQTGMVVKEQILLYKNNVSIHDPFRIKTSPAALQKDMQYIIESSIQPVSWVKEQYDIDAPGYLRDQLKFVKKRESMPRSLQISEAFRNAVALHHSSIERDVAYNGGEGGDEDTTLHHKIYFAPYGSEYKSGRLCIFTDTAVIYDGEPDIPRDKKLRIKLKRWNPYTPLIWRRNPLRLEGIPYVEDLIPINKQINSIDAMIMEHLEKSAEPERIVFNNVVANNDDNSGNDTVIDPLPGLPNGGAPQYLSNPQIPNELYRLRGEKVAELEKLGGVTEVVQGLRPAGVDTYRGLQLLHDAADNSEAEYYDNFHRYKRSATQLKLAIIQECTIKSDPDFVEVLNTIAHNEDLGTLEIDHFLGEDLRNNLNIVIEEADYLSQSKAAETDRVENLLKAMILEAKDLQDPYVKLKLMRRLGMAEMPMADKADIEKAERIIQYLEAGNFQKVGAVLSLRDNKALQLRVWSEWMKTSRYESLDPQIQAAADELLKKVENEVIRAQQQMASQQQGLPMRSPPPGGVNGAQQGKPPPSVPMQ